MMDQLRTNHKTKQKNNAILSTSETQQQHHQYSSSPSNHQRRHVPIEEQEEEEDHVILAINKYDNDSFMDSNSVGGGLNYLVNRNTLGYYSDDDTNEEEVEVEKDGITSSPSTPRTVHGYDDHDEYLYEQERNRHGSSRRRDCSPKEEEVVRRGSNRRDYDYNHHHDVFNIDQYKSRNVNQRRHKLSTIKDKRQERPPPPPSPRDPSISGGSTIRGNNSYNNPENTHPPANNNNNNEPTSSSSSYNIIASAAIISTTSASQITFDTHTTLGSTSTTTSKSMNDDDDINSHNNNGNNKGLYSVKTSSIIPHQVTFPIKKTNKEGMSVISEEEEERSPNHRLSPRDSPRSNNSSRRNKRRGIDASPTGIASYNNRGIDASPGIQNMSTELIEYKKSKAIVRSSSKSSEGKRRRRSRSTSQEEDDYNNKKRDNRRRSRVRNNDSPQDDQYGREERRYNRSSSSKHEGRGKHSSRQLTTYNKGDVSVQSSSTSSSWRSIRHDMDADGYCKYHPNIQLMKRRSSSKDHGSLWRTIRKKCPECIIEDCPSMMGYDDYDDSSGRRSNGGSSIVDNNSMDDSVISHRQQALMLYSSSGQYHMSANNSLAYSDSNFNSSSSYNNDELMLNMGLSLTTPEEMEEEEATLRLKRRLAGRAYHFPGNTWLQDWIQYLSNTHTVLGLFFHHPLHPMGFQERLVILFGSIAIGLTISNFTYLYFIRNELGHDEEVLNIPIIGYSVSITKLMITLWTLGSFIHTVFDLGLWHMKACTICRYQGNSYIDERLIRWGRVVGLFIVMIAMGAGGYAVLLRASIEYKGEGSVADEVEESIKSTELYQIEFEDKRSFRFLLGYLVEFVLALFVYYPIAVTILFSGVLGCGGRIPVLGGRPREMKRERRYEMRKARPKILKANIEDDEEEEMDDCDSASDVYATSYRDDESRDRFNEDQII